MHHHLANIVDFKGYRAARPHFLEVIGCRIIIDIVLIIFAKCQHRQRLGGQRVVVGLGAVDHAGYALGVDSLTDNDFTGN